MRVRGESEKASLKLGIQENKIVAFGPITSWQIDEEKVETVTDFWGAPKSLWMVIAAMKLKDTYSLEEKAMAPHSSTLAWKIPWMEETGRLQSMGLLRVRY